jgi:predicted DNA-binding transcriptional regulator AlpA
MLDVVDPPEVKRTKAWLAIDGVKGDWEVRRASCKDWKLPFDDLHEDVYTLLAVRNLTLAPMEYISEFLFNVFGVLPSEKLTLKKLRQQLQQREIEEISRRDLIKLSGITSQALNDRINKQGHPKPCRVSGRKQWFSIAAVEEWKKSRVF